MQKLLIFIFIAFLNCICCQHLRHLQETSIENNHIEGIRHEHIAIFERAAELYYQFQSKLRYDYKLVASDFTRVESNYPCVYGVVPIG
jgi:hypothetical protein